MALFRCKMCGGTLEITDQSVAVCEYCGTKQTLPKLADDKKATLYDRANHFRRNNEFDKAMALYEQILNEDPEDSESYWSIVLCRYGIEYVEDPVSHKRVPTVNRAQYTSIFADVDYKNALKYADDYQRSIYEEEAQAIDDIQKGILAISAQEEPFDVFICYKETDMAGRRAPDSVYAQEIYNALTKEGYKVFFSRITLEDKLGTAYEPYIFSALNSAKVMIAVGTKPEHFNAVWVKNEWSRYLALIKNGEKKTLIPAYRDMSPYDLPEEFAYLQAQDMGKIGYVQDIVRGVQKLIMPADQKSTGGSVGNIVDSTLSKVKEFLAAGDFTSAELSVNAVRGYDPTNAMAFIYQLMIKEKITHIEKLADINRPLEDMEDFKNAVKFADKQLKNQLNGYNKNSLYNYALQQANIDKEQSLATAIASLEKIPEFRDSRSKIIEFHERLDNVIYDSAIKEAEHNSVQAVQNAIKIMEKIPHYKDSTNKVAEFHQKIAELEKAEKKKRNMIKMAVLAVVAIIVGIIGFNSYQQSQRLKAEAEAIRVEANRIIASMSSTANSEDTISLGKYFPTSNSTKSIAIKWQVLDILDDKALLITDEIIDAQGFCQKDTENVTWETSDLRAWLNNDFIDTAFTEAEQLLICKTILDNGEHNTTIDKVFLMSEAEITSYYTDKGSLRAVVSARAKALGCSTIQSGHDFIGSYRLRDVKDGNKGLLTKYIDCYGSVANCTTYELQGVRPAMWISLEEIK